jgi:hypothetical protein
VPSARLAKSQGADSVVARHSSRLRSAGFAANFGAAARQNHLGWIGGNITLRINVQVTIALSTVADMKFLIVAALDMPLFIVVAPQSPPRAFHRR